MGSRPIGEPHFVTDRAGKMNCEAITRQPFAGKDMQEEWLQRLLEQCPGLLPVAEVDERVETPLTSLGREVPTGSGPIDNLFISENGQLVVVETKLWRNAQARREVVAQILDYAQHVRAWSYTRLCEIAKTDLWQLVRPQREDEPRWIDRVNENLTKGRMTLLIVGDGIQSEAEGLVNVVGDRPDFPFRLALVELRMYQQGEGRWLIIPSTLAKTVEVERAIVTIATVNGATGAVTVKTPTVETRRTNRQVLSEQAFLDELRGVVGGVVATEVATTLLRELDRDADRGLLVEWKSRSFTVKAHDPAGTGLLVSLAVVGAAGTIGTYLPWLPDQIEKRGADKKAAERLVKMIADTYTKFDATKSKSGKDIGMPIVILKGRERDFVNALADIAAQIEKLHPKD